MLFASGLRKAVDQADPSAQAILVTAEETNRLLIERRRRQMIRRHTCSTLKPDAQEIRSVSFLTPPLEAVEDESEPSEVGSDWLGEGILVGFCSAEVWMPPLLTSAVAISIFSSISVIFLEYSVGEVKLNSG